MILKSTASTANIATCATSVPAMTEDVSIVTNVDSAGYAASAQKMQLPKFLMSALKAMLLVFWTHDLTKSSTSSLGTWCALFP